MGAAAAGTSSLPQPSLCLSALGWGGYGKTWHERQGQSWKRPEGDGGALLDPLSSMCGRYPCGLYSVKLGIFLCKKVFIKKPSPSEWHRVTFSPNRDRGVSLGAAGLASRG